MNKFILSFLLINQVFVHFSWTQNPDKIDSLIHKLETAEGVDRGTILNHLGREYLYLDLQQSREYTGQALNLALAEKWDEIEATAYTNFGSLHLLTGQYDSAMTSYNHALTYYQKHGDKLNIARINHEIGVVHFRKGEYSDALVIYKKASSAYRDLDFTVGVSSISSSIGDVYRYLGEYTKALEYYLQGLKLAEALEDIPRKAALLNSLGLISFKEKKYDKALEYYHEGLILAEELDFDFYISAFLANIADIYAEKGNFKKALDFHFRSLEIERQQQNLDGEAQSLSSLGFIYKQMENYEKAVESFKASLAIADSIGAARSIALNCNQLSWIFRNQKRLQESLAYGQRALESATRQGFKEQIYAAHLNLAKGYAAMSNYEQAYENYKSYTSIKDSVFNETKTEQMTEMQVKYETEKKEQQIASMQKEAEIEVFKRNAYALGLFGTFIIAVLIIGWLKVRMNRAKKIKEQEDFLTGEKLRLYEKELKRFTKNALEKTNRIESLNQELEKVREEIVDGSGRYLGHLDKLMQATILTEMEWEEFKTLFEKVHPSFFGNLRTRYPDLSAAEIRMAALVKLNLTSKEISGMLGISHESVNKSRYRLRKKLNLLKDEKLETHLKNL